MGEPTQKQDPAKDNGVAFDDGVIKVDLSKFNNDSEPAESEAAVEEEVVETAPEPTVKEVVGTEPEAVAEEPVTQEVKEEEVTSVLEEVTEEVAEEVESLEQKFDEALTEQEETGAKLPEDIDKLVKFMEETGGSLEDYVKLSADHSTLSEEELLREYYEASNPNLDNEDIEFLLQEEFDYDEDLDDDRTIRAKKINRKKKLVEAKQHLDSLKDKYYTELKSGSKLSPDQQKAVEFFDRYNKEQGELTKKAQKQHEVFTSKTEKLFSNDFKGFDFSVGDKKFRYKVNNAEAVKTQQSDINNFVKKFLNNNNEIVDAAGYHKSLFTAMNPDAIANHFYQQGRADAIKNSAAKAKNIDMDPRGTHSEVTASNGWKVKAVPSEGNSSKLKIKRR